MNAAMPYLTNGNIYVPVMMLAEKAALILGNTPLLPSEVDFFWCGRQERSSATASGDLEFLRLHHATRNGSALPVMAPEEQ